MRHSRHSKPGRPASPPPVRPGGVPSAALAEDFADPAVTAAEDFADPAVCATCVFHEAVRVQTTAGWAFTRRCAQKASPLHQFLTRPDEGCDAHRPRIS